MGRTTAYRTHLWVGTDFATHSIWQSGKVVAFTCLYTAPTRNGFSLKERFWENGTLLTTKEVGTHQTKRNIVQMFQTALEQFKDRRSNEARQKGLRMRVQTRSPLKWRTPKIGEHITSLRPIEAYFSGSAGLPLCSFEPGDIGIVVVVDMPAVQHIPENPSDLFACADFEKPGLVSLEGPRQCSWRCHVYYHHVLPLSAYPNGNDG